jgi:hypothetical protein
MATPVERYQGIAKAGGGFNDYSAGKKHYGGGRSAPNIGPSDPSGYAERDARLKAQQNNLLKRIQQQQGSI